MTAEIIAMWVTVVIYVVATIMFVFGVIFEKERLTNQALLVTAAGLVPQLIAVGVRWVRLGHGPYIGYYELANALTLCTVALFVFTTWRNRRLLTTGIGIMPVATLMLGAAMLASKADFPITPSLASYWLYIHVAFANLAFAAFAISFGYAIAYLIRARSQDGVWARRLRNLPSQEIVDDLVGRFVLAGFLLWGIMIVTGAIWAEESWGRYWSWDPIETWSLIVWIIYAIYLHLRYMLRIPGQKLAWYAVAAMPIALFCLVGIPTVFDTIHAGYIGGVEGQIQ
ncbi:MAG: cytochrome c biogenesis protein CcsA [Coriobacteriia bacterium]|nr:cytochrome c biogenesis protein CcsA [Coriobacteriia bacterium]